MDDNSTAAPTLENGWQIIARQNGVVLAGDTSGVCAIEHVFSTAGKLATWRLSPCGVTIWGHYFCERSHGGAWRAAALDSFASRASSHGAWADSALRPRLTYVLGIHGE